MAIIKAKERHDAERKAEDLANPKRAAIIKAITEQAIRTKSYAKAFFDHYEQLKNA